MSAKKLIFWQNCISPHQLPYIENLIKLSQVLSVYLVVPVSTLPERERMGWDSTFATNLVDIYVDPNEETVEKLLSDTNNCNWHFFSGIRADKFVYNWFKKSLNYEINRAIITEGPFTYKWPLILHKFRFYFFDYKYIDYIKHVYAIGKDCKDYYESISSKWKVIDFVYCVKTYYDDLSLISETPLINIAFVGTFSVRKNPLLLLNSLNIARKKSPYFSFKLSLIGFGKLYKKMYDFCKKAMLFDSVFFYGNLSNNHTIDILKTSDVLVLPSTHDGWGAVVNEALNCGVFVICSNKCGSKALIENSNRGIVFISNNHEDLTNALLFLCQNLTDIRKGKTERFYWAKTHISGEVIAKYLVDTLEKENVVPPWLS
ncbi:glycosyltransferase [Runella zeae]|uniref:glycosyltransferase n=1 Tax=Runella zeae TaxID=94255 RepID=UPI0023521688|nr:glycosyltransferase [Runella zeae]